MFPPTALCRSLADLPAKGKSLVTLLSAKGGSAVLRVVALVAPCPSSAHLYPDSCCWLQPDAGGWHRRTVGVKAPVEAGGGWRQCPDPARARPHRRVLQPLAWSPQGQAAAEGAACCGWAMGAVPTPRLSGSSARLEQLWFSCLFSGGKGATSVNKPQKS